MHYVAMRLNYKKLQNLGSLYYWACFGIINVVCDSLCRRGRCAHHQACSTPLGSTLLLKANYKEITKAHAIAFCVGNPLVTSGFHSKRADDPSKSHRPDSCVAGKLKTISWTQVLHLRAPGAPLCRCCTCPQLAHLCTAGAPWHHHVSGVGGVGVDAKWEFLPISVLNSNLTKSISPQPPSYISNHSESFHNFRMTGLWNECYGRREFREVTLFKWYRCSVSSSSQWVWGRCQSTLTHWGRVTHICVSRLTVTGPDNGLSPGRRQAIIWTNAGILFIGPLGTNFSENLIEILPFSFTKMRLKVSSAKWRPGILSRPQCVKWSVMWPRW